MAIEGEPRHSLSKKTPSPKGSLLAAAAITAATATATSSCIPYTYEPQIVKVEVPVPTPPPRIYITCPRGTQPTRELVPYQDGLLGGCEGDIGGIVTLLAKAKERDVIETVRKAAMDVLVCPDAKNTTNCQEVRVIKTPPNQAEENSFAAKIMKITGGENAIPLKPGKQDLIFSGEIRHPRVKGAASIMAEVKQGSISTTTNFTIPDEPQKTVVTITVPQNYENTDSTPVALSGYHNGIAFMVNLHPQSQSTHRRTGGGVSQKSR